MARKKMGQLQQWKFWRKHFEQWKNSGLSQNQYCHQHSLSQSQLSKWKLKIQLADIEAKANASSSSDAVGNLIAAQNFVEIKLPQAASDYRIEFANGKSLIFTANYEREIISDLVAILEQSC